MNKKSSWKQYKQKARALIERLKDIPCVDCGLRYSHYVMDFDHRSDKKYNISYMAGHTGLGKIVEEALKCDVVCSNCHRERTYGPDKRKG